MMMMRELSGQDKERMAVAVGWRFLPLLARGPGLTHLMRTTRSFCVIPSFEKKYTTFFMDFLLYLRRLGCFTSTSCRLWGSKPISSKNRAFSSIVLMLRFMMAGSFTSRDGWSDFGIPNCSRN